MHTTHIHTKGHHESDIPIEISESEMRIQHENTVAYLSALNISNVTTASKAKQSKKNEINTEYNNHLKSIKERKGNGRERQRKGTQTSTIGRKKDIAFGKEEHKEKKYISQR